MNKTHMLLVLLFVFLPTVKFAQDRHTVSQRSPNTSPSGETRYFLRLYNCDSRCAARLNDNVIASSGFAQDAGWMEVTCLLREGLNRIRFEVWKDSVGAITYGFQLRKNGTLLLEKACGRAGSMGCENNRVFGITSGAAREFTYDVRVPPAEMAVLNAQKARMNSAASQAWPQFWSAFRDAINKRDRRALADLMSNPFSESGNGTTPSDYFRLFRGQEWRGLDRSVKSETKPSQSCECGQVCRVSRDDWLIFAFGGDGKWRWLGTEFRD